MRIRQRLLILAAVTAGLLAPAPALAGRAARVPGRVVVAAHHGRFLAWPANNGFWSWDDGRELLVGFSDGPWQRRPEGHQVGQPQLLRLARSRDGGHSWRVETPPEGLNQIGEPQVPASGGVDFAAPDLAVRVVAGGGKGTFGRLGAFHVSQDRGRTWRGPFAFRGLEDDPRLFGLRFSSRTSVLPLGPQSALFLLSVQDPSLPRWSGRLDKSLAVRSDDGGRTFRMLGWLVPWRDPYRAVMPAAVALGPDQLVAALRRRDPFGDDSANWIDLVASTDGGRHWQFRSRVGESGCCNGNPPALTRLRDGRLACAWADRSRRQLLLRLSADQGRSWGPERVLRSNPDNHDMGYPQIHENDRGELVVIYYLATPERPQSFIEATLLAVPR